MPPVYEIILCAHEKDQITTCLTQRTPGCYCFISLWEHIYCRATSAQMHKHMRT